MQKIHLMLIKSILLLVICALISWVESANASEQWDARTTARVNLRKHPGSSGTILSIVPKGHKIRIMETDGNWHKVKVEGNVHGKGWLHGDYVEQTTPKKAETALIPEGVTSETVAVEPNKGNLSIEPLHPAPTKTEKPGPLKTPEIQNPLPAAAKEQASIRNDPVETSNETGNRLIPEIAAADESTYIHLDQMPLEIDTAAESEKQSDSSSLRKDSAMDPKEQVSTVNEVQAAINEIKAPPKIEIAAAAKMTDIDHSRTLPETRTEVEKPKPVIASLPVKSSTAAPEENPSPELDPQAPEDDLVTPLEVESPTAKEPVRMPTDPSSHADPKPEAPGVGLKLFLGTAEQRDATPQAKNLSSWKSSHADMIRETTPPIGEKVRKEVRRLLDSIESPTAPPKKIGPIQLVLKLVSIVLSFSVILLLYLDNRK